MRSELPDPAHAPRPGALLRLAVDACIFGFASVEVFRAMYRIAGRHDARGVSYVFNRFFHERQRATASDDWLAAPNSEVLYSNAWLDISNAPVRLYVPDMGDRYYVLQFLDFFANPFAYAGTRTSGNRVLNLVITGPEWAGPAASDEVIVRSPTNFAWIFGRIGIHDDRDLDEVHRLQDRMALTPVEGIAGPNPAAQPWPPFRTGGKLDLFANLDQVLRRNAAPRSDAGLISGLTQLGMLSDQPFDPDLADRPLRNVLERAIVLGIEQISVRESQFVEFSPGWIWEGPAAGRPGRDPLSRAASAKAGLGILPPEEAIYPFAYVDSDGEPLDGSRRYQLTFPPGGLPQAKYFWSLTVYSLPHYQLVRNPINRYALSSASWNLKAMSDGTVRLGLQSDEPEDQEANWLPVPKTGNFVVALRVFGPKETLLRGEYQLPPVRKLRHAGDSSIGRQTEACLRAARQPS